MFSEFFAFRYFVFLFDDVFSIDIVVLFVMSCFLFDVLLVMCNFVFMNVVVCWY